MDIDAVARLRGVIGKLSRRLNASATGEGLTPSQASALGVVHGNGPLSLSELTAIEGLNPTMVSRVIGRLDELGLLRRIPNPQDLRAGMVEITPEGTSTHERIKAERGRVVSDCLNRLPEQDRDAIIAALPALEALAAELKDVSGRP